MPAELDQQIAIKELEKDGWTYWFPPRTWGERDIFGVYDFIAAKKRTVIHVQLTTIGHVSERVRKVKAFFYTYKVCVPNSYVWGWNPKLARFKKIKVNG
jgi:hypothetical protein